MTLTKEAKAKCEGLYRNLELIRGDYKKLTDKRHKKIFEYGIACIIKYITNRGLKFWSEKISEGLLRKLRNSNYNRFSADHDPPRKVLAIQYLNDPKFDNISEQDFLKDFEEKVKFNMVTSKENKDLRPFQKFGVYKSSEKAYEDAEITLIDIDEAERSRIFSTKTSLQEKRRLIDAILERIIT